jgi:hypothetical protein
MAGMDLQPETLSALKKWLGCDTWHKDHPLDQRRFFHFVNGLRQDIGQLDGNEDNLLELMWETLDLPRWGGSREKAEEIFAERIGDIWVILDFCETVGIPRSI